MPGLRSLALAAGFLFSSSLHHGFADSPEDVALAEDDQCAFDDSDCALNALQRRVRAGNVAGDTVESSRRRRETAQGHDISESVAEELEMSIYDIYKNVTTMQWRVYYMKWDLKSAEDEVDDVPNRTIGVNGSNVNWDRHSITWIPIFLLQDGPGEEAPEGLEAESLLESGRSMSGRRRRHASSSLVGVPPRTKKCQLYMTKVQEMLDQTQEEIAKLERDILAVDDSMVTLAQDSAVVEHTELVDDEEETDEGIEASITVKTSEGRRRRTTETESGLHQPEEARQLIMDQIEEATNETTLLWSKIGDLSDQLQQLKARMGIDASDDFPDEEVVAAIATDKAEAHGDDKEGEGISDGADSSESTDDTDLAKVADSADASKGADATDAGAA